MLKCVSQALQRALKSKNLYSVVKKGDRTTLLFRHPKTGATVVKHFTPYEVYTAGYKAGERTNKIVKDFNVFGNLEQNAHLMPSIYKPDKVVQQFTFPAETYVAQNGLLTKIVNGQKVSVEPQSMEKVLNSIVWA